MDKNVDNKGEENIEETKIKSNEPKISPQEAFKQRMQNRNGTIPPDFPELEAEIPKTYLFDSCRFQAELPPIVKAPSFNIRKFGKKLFTLEDYVAQGTMTENQRKIIMKAIKEHKNIIAAGGTASGKTTLLNAILAEISDMKERIVIIEDTS